MTMLVPGLTGLLGITPIGIIDGLVIGGSAVLPLLVNEATKKTSGGSMDKVGNRVQATLESEACPAADGAIPIPPSIKGQVLGGGNGKSKAPLL